MKIIVLDLETTVQNMDGVKDNSPYNPLNKIVSVHWRMIEDGVVGEAQRAIFHHDEILKAYSSVFTPALLKNIVSEALADADLMVAHNAKYDLSYLLEAGFECPPVYCTMIGEYIFARGQDVQKSLSATAERRDVTRKKSHLVDDLFKSGVGFESMPLDTMVEYADADVLSCAEVYLAQQAQLLEEANTGLLPIFTLMNEMLEFLTEIERNGIKIDVEKLDEVEKDLEVERQQLQIDLNNIVKDIMGDTPINLQSGNDMSQVIYSRYIVNKDYWKRTFMIGTNSAGKPLPPPRMSESKFINTVRKATRKVNKTIAQHCVTCDGRGTFRKYKKNGDPYKLMSPCIVCEKRGYTLLSDGRVAGLKLSPQNAMDASANGFKTDKVTIQRLISQARHKENLVAVEFLTKITRLNAVATYLDSSIAGIRQWTRRGGFLHSQFNQTTTRTGRLSSSNPNFQNQSKKFPVRRCVVSRFDGGEILEMDYSGLEFRVAGLLSGDAQIKEDVLNGKDIHRQTASIIHRCDPKDVSKDLRQASKQFSFAPLYGGMGMGEPPHVQNYFKEFFNVYGGLKKWHTTLTDGVIKDGLVRTPSGREFLFPNVRRIRGGRVSNQTAIVNYPCQSFATADIVPLSCIRAFRRFKREHLKSKIILTVHDSIVVDIFPGESGAVVRALTWAMRDINDEIFERFNFKVNIPLDVEAEIGDNWMDTTEINVA